LAVRGESGVADMLNIVKKEMQVAMALTGVNRISEITEEILA